MIFCGKTYHRSFYLKSITLTAAAAVIIGTAGCKTTAPAASSNLKETTTAPAVNGIPASNRNLCVGVRGNGNLIMAHFGAYARIVEHYGLIDGVAGGSSGSVSFFLYESIYANKALRACELGACSKAEEGRRAGLLLKSIQGYLQYIAKSADEAAAFLGLTPIYKKAKEQGMDSLLISDKIKARNLLIKLLESPDVKDIVNEELIHLLKTSPNPEYHTRTVYDGLANATEWKTDDPIILVRPGVINFEGLTRKIGRIASFYAGYGPADQTASTDFLNSCATEENRKKTWEEISGPADNPTPCGKMFFSLLGNYRQKLLENEASFPSRIDDDIGMYLPAMIATSILEGQRAADRFSTSRKNFLAGSPLDWKSDFDDVMFGYWGAEADLKKMAANTRNYSDLKTQKFLSLGQKKWKEVLKYSPAEPGLARAQEMSPTRISAGGWSDLQPVLALKNIGCKSTVFVTRRGAESEFAIGVAKLLGMQPDGEAKLYPLVPAADGTESSALQAIAGAEGIWCSNWNLSTTGNIKGTIADTYNAPFEARTNAPIALVPYKNSSPKVDFLGCTPGSTSTGGGNGLR